MSEIEEARDPHEFGGTDDDLDNEDRDHKMSDCQKINLREIEEAINGPIEPPIADQLLAMREHINAQGAMLKSLAAHMGLKLEIKDVGNGKTAMRWVEASERRIVTL